MCAVAGVYKGGEGPRFNTSPCNSTEVRARERERERTHREVAAPPTQPDLEENDV